MTLRGRLMLKITKETPIMPSSLFVKGINAKFDHDFICRGGFGFVFRGELEGTPVALKLLYKTRRDDASRPPFMLISIADHGLIGSLPRSFDTAIS
jgi:hypothetical protein